MLYSLAQIRYIKIHSFTKGTSRLWEKNRTNPYFIPWGLEVMFIVFKVEILVYRNWSIPVASSDCEICLCCNNMANILQRHVFQFPGRDTADMVEYVSSGRLREVKSNRKLRTVIPKNGRDGYESFCLE